MQRRLEIRLFGMEIFGETLFPGIRCVQVPGTFPPAAEMCDAQVLVRSRHIT